MPKIRVIIKANANGHPYFADVQGATDPHSLKVDHDTDGFNDDGDDVSETTKVAFIIRPKNNPPFFFPASAADAFTVRNAVLDKNGAALPIPNGVTFTPAVVADGGTGYRRRLKVEVKNNAPDVGGAKAPESQFKYKLKFVDAAGNALYYLDPMIVNRQRQ
jgi:hypothetical protein